MKAFLNIIFIVFVFSSACYAQHNKSFRQLDSISRAFYEAQRLDSAINNGEQALHMAEFEFGQNDTNYCNSLNFLFNANYKFGEYKKGLIYCLKEKEVRLKLHGEKHPAYATCINNLALVYDELGKYSLAETLYIEAKNLRKEILGNKHPMYATSVSNLGLFYKTLGNYALAEPLYKEAMQIDKEISGGNSFNYATSLHNLASLYRVMGNFQAAEKQYVDALKIIEKVNGKKSTAYATSLNSLGILYKSLNNYTAAEPIYLEALQIRKELLGEKHPSYATSLNNLALLYRDIGNLDTAEILINQAINIQKDKFGENHPSYATTINNLAEIYHTKGAYVKAQKLYEKAIQIRKDFFGEKNISYATALYNLAYLYNDMGNLSSAELFFNNMLEIINYNINNNFSFLSEKEQELYFMKQSLYFERFYTFALKRKKDNSHITETVFNNVIKNKGLMLKSSTAMRTAIINSKDTALINQYENWINLKKEISKLYATEISKRSNDPEILENQANELEKKLVKQSVDFSNYGKINSLTWRNVQQSLKKDEVAIEFIHFQTSKDSTLYCALLIKSDSQFPEMLPLFEQKELEILLKSKTENSLSFVKNVYGTNQQSQQELYKLIWKPLEKYLKDVKTIYFSPDGLMHKISFAAISKGKNMYLCDNFQLKQMSSTINLVKPELGLIDSKFSTAIFGGIEYSSNSDTIEVWEYLPGTFQEAEKINQLLLHNKMQTFAWQGNKATESEFKSKAELYNILHITTHGFFYPNPEDNRFYQEDSLITDNLLAMVRSNGFGKYQFLNNSNPLMRSGIVFAGANGVWNKQYSNDADDGILTAYEVSNMNLQNTQLVVLSACETGLGDIKGSEGVYGLQRAFKMAGVKYIIMSLWQVPDKETVEFMSTFYTKLLKQKDIRKAFSETQKILQKKYDPYYWAAFVLIE